MAKTTERMSFREGWRAEREKAKADELEKPKFEDVIKAVISVAFVGFVVWVLVIGWNEIIAWVQWFAEWLAQKIVEGPPD